MNEIIRPIKILATIKDFFNGKAIINTINREPHVDDFGRDDKGVFYCWYGKKWIELD